MSHSIRIAAAVPVIRVADVAFNAASIAAWAMLPCISCLYILLSKRMEELKSSAIGSVSPAVTPAHIFAMSLSLQLNASYFLP